ncbi:hypothetical protein [Marivita sp.]|uniref:hypothetical protein n=1 Tax=Marivita sp. TaxID=2003365 RepID=UPI0025C5CC46|nr:hypothetical protein [Marivita sp.]
MLERVFLFIFVCLTLQPDSADANLGTVRAGEHEDFTRVTISTELPISSVELEQVRPRLFRMTTRPTITALDASRLFDRISAERIGRITGTPDSLEFALNCDCMPTARTENAQLIVMDVPAPTNLPTVTLPVFPVWSERRFDLGRDATVSGKPDRSFDLDYKFVDALTKKIAEQIGQSAHIKGFVDLPVIGPSEQDREPAPEMATEDNTPDVSACEWTQEIWEHVTAPEKERGPDLIGFETLETSIRQSVVKYLANGMIEEAKHAFAALEPNPQQSLLFLDVVALIDGSETGARQQLTHCNPLHDLLFASVQSGTATPNDLKIIMLQSFGRLPPGLQIALFPRLKWLLDEAGQAMFADLMAHREAELALQDRKPVRDAATTEMQADPDALAAVSLELRDTDFEKASWHAAFASYLEHRRYFDAASELKSGAPLTLEEKADAVSRFVEHLVAHADSVPFVEIALKTAELNMVLSDRDLSLMAERLDQEGFFDEASQLVNTKPTTAPVLGDPDAIAEIQALGMPEDPGQDPVSGSGEERGRKDQVSVAVAQSQLKEAEIVRKSLLERYAE